MVGNPAKQNGWVNNNGEKLKEISTNIFTDSQGNNYEVVEERLIQN